MSFSVVCDVCHVRMRADQVMSQFVIDHAHADPKRPPKFTCPKCGAHTFGTMCEGYPQGSSIEDGQAYFDAHAVGVCSGSGCGFRWKRRDDAKYFERKT